MESIHPTALYTPSLLLTGEQLVQFMACCDFQTIDQPYEPVDNLGKEVERCWLPTQLDQVLPDEWTILSNTEGYVVVERHWDTRGWLIYPADLGATSWELAFYHECQQKWQALQTGERAAD